MADTVKFFKELTEKFEQASKHLEDDEVWHNMIRSILGEHNNWLRYTQLDYESDEKKIKTLSDGVFAMFSIVTIRSFLETMLKVDISVIDRKLILANIETAICAYIKDVERHLYVKE